MFCTQVGSAVLEGLSLQKCFYSPAFTCRVVLKISRVLSGRGRRCPKSHRSCRVWSGAFQAHGSDSCTLTRPDPRKVTRHTKRPQQCVCSSAGDKKLTYSTSCILTLMRGRACRTQFSALKPGFPITQETRFFSARAKALYLKQGMSPTNSARKYGAFMCSCKTLILTLVNVSIALYTFD